MRIADCRSFGDVRDAYEKMIALNEKLNALITPIPPEENPNGGRLCHVPVLLKDNVSTKGIRTTAACRLLENYVPPFDATVVEKLRAEGAVFLGKTSMDELSMGGSNLTSFTGPVYNPYDFSRIPGGSSGGSAVLTAAGAVPLAIGSDTGDSVRKPASYCGIVGVKPTYGRISRYGIIPYASSLDHVGFFTTAVEDAFLALQILSGKDERDLTTFAPSKHPLPERIDPSVAGKKILIFQDVLNNTPKETRVLFDRIVASLKEKGARIEEIRFRKDLLELVLPVYSLIADAEALSNHADLSGAYFGERIEGTDFEEMTIRSRTAGFGSVAKKRFLIGAYSLSDGGVLFTKARKVRRLLVEEILSGLKDADALIAPSTPKGAPLIRESGAPKRKDSVRIADNHLVLGNLGGFPSMSVPMGMVSGLPVGFSITSNLYDEGSMFAVAKAVEEITGLCGVTKEGLL